MDHDLLRKVDIELWFVRMSSEYAIPYIHAA